MSGVEILKDEEDENSEMNDTYEKRDRMSQYKKMNLNTHISESMIPNHSNEKDSDDSPKNNIANLKSKTNGLPLGPNNKTQKLSGSNIS